MKTELVVQLNKTFEGSTYTQNGVEYWMARDLQQLLDYEEWRNFFKVIDKAKIACLKSKQNISDHFVDVNKMIDIGKGDNALFGGYTPLEMKKKLGVSQKRPLADFLPTITIKAKDLAAEITSFNTKKNNLRGDQAITGEHIKNNKGVRELLGKSGIKQESLPPEEDVKKLARRLNSDGKKIAQSVKNIKRL